MTGVLWLIGFAACHGQLLRASEPATIHADASISRVSEAQLRERIGNNPGDVEAARSLADLLERSGRTRAAVVVRRSLLAQANNPKTLAQTQLELATALVEAGQSAEAISLLQVVVAREPANEPAMFELGTALARQQEYVAAAAAFEQATRLQPNDVEAQLSTAKVLVTLLRYVEAEPYLDAVARAGRQDFDTAMLRGLINSHTDRPAQAAQAFAEAVRQKPDDADAQLRLGEVLRAAGRPLDAIAPLRRSAELRPSVSAYFQLGKSYRELGRTEEAQRAGVSLKTLEDQRATATRVDALTAEAEHEVAATHYAQAAVAYQAALQLHPQDAALLYRLALVRGQMHQTEAEEQLLKEALAQSPLLGGALAQLGTLEASQGRTIQARQHFTEALRLDAQQADALGGLGVLAAREGNLASADLLLHNAVESDPTSPELFRNFGLVAAAEGHFAEAERALLQSRLLAPDVPQTELALGQLYLLRKKYAAAVGPLRSATTLRPNEGEAFLALAQVFYFLGETEHAVSAERQGLALMSRTEAITRQARLCSSLGGSPDTERNQSACQVSLVPESTNAPLQTQKLSPTH